MEVELDQELVDRKEAEFINFLVDKGVIDPARISKASIVVFRELLERNEEEVVLHGERGEKGDEHQIPQDKIDKIKVLLGNRSEQSHEDVERALNTARMVLETLIEKSGFPVSGAIVCGSRVDKDKSPNQKSDLDMYVYVNSRDLLIGTDTQLDKWQAVVDELELPYRVVINGALDRNTLVKNLETPTDTSSVPKWGWNPGAFKFIGNAYFDGKEFVDGAATKFISDKLSQPQWDDIRRKRIREIEQRISSLISKP